MQLDLRYEYANPVDLAFIEIAVICAGAALQ
jgi:hypothetical protein